MTLEHLVERLKDLPQMMRSEPWGLFTDIDGTISEMVERPEAAMVRPGCAVALDTLAHQLAVVVVITGRDIESARRMVGVDNAIYFGNHGIERWEKGTLEVTPEARPYVPRLQRIGKALSQRLDMPGVIVEDKAVGLSVHYRLAEEPDAARSVILSAVEAVDTEGWLEVREGKMIVELRLPVAIDKGTAVQSVVREKQLRGAIVLGDDTTDVDAFRAARRLQEGGDFTGVSIAVVGDETPSVVVNEATYTLPGTVAVEGFLVWLSRELKKRA
ncbi:MAG: trehalose-phosphatase [Chloroflexi bacterium]|nr:trehalose-phosphatase [Chloroflexota bacterium]